MRINPAEILNSVEIKRGGFGKVFIADYRGDKVAVKIIPGGTGGREATSAFINEMKTWNSIPPHDNSEILVAVLLLYPLTCDCFLSSSSQRYPI
jgi:hypothetical protein